MIGRTGDNLEKKRLWEDIVQTSEASEETLAKLDGFHVRIRSKCLGF